MAAGICRTDLHLIQTFQQLLGRTLILGHEIVGEVVRLGGSDGVLEPGQLVVAHRKLVCGHCEQCLGGRETLCTDARVLGIDRDGGFAEYVTTEASRVLPLPDTITPASGAALACGGVTAYHALRTIAGVRPSETVLILGTGGVGLFAVQIAKSIGAKVLAADVRPAVLARAAALGADKTILVNSEDPGQLATTLGPDAADVVLDLVGDPDLTGPLASVVRLGGRYVVISGHPDSRLSIAPFPLFRRELAFLGSRGSSFAELKELLELAAAKAHDSSVTVQAPLERGAEVLRQVDAGDVVGRAVLLP